jgi:hypothetical protein
MNNIMSLWGELKTLFEAVELDVAKNARGNSSAGVRARKGLRELQKKAKELVKVTVEAEKAAKTSKEEEGG